MRRNSILLDAFLFVAGPCAAMVAVTTAHAEPAIHLVVVADTLDHKIGQSVQVDMQMIEGTFLGQVLEGDRLKIETVDREKCHPDAILQRIAAVRLAPEDALVVFFSGHGATTIRKNSTSSSRVSGGEHSDAQAGTRRHQGQGVQAGGPAHGLLQ